MSETGGESLDPGSIVEYPQAAVAACCSAVYGHPFAELIMGESFHPGGLSATRRLLTAASPERGAAILDLGCGLGASSRLAHDEFGLDVVAVDVSRNVLRQAKERTGDRDMEWLQADGEDLPFDDASFDIVLAECVLSAMPRTRALAEIARVLRHDGVLLMSDVRRSGEPVDALDDHPLLGMALCVSTAWTPNEFDGRATDVALVPTRSWDRDEDVQALLDRIEGRMTIARDLLKGAASQDGPAGAFAGVDGASVQQLLASVRSAVDGGRIGYFAAVARPAGAVLSGPR